MAHSDSFIINIYIAAIQRLTARVLDVSNKFQNKKFPIHERVCFITPPYHLDYCENYYPNVPLNRDYGPFFIQIMNVI